MKRKDQISTLLLIQATNIPKIMLRKGEASNCSLPKQSNWSAYGCLHKKES